jgi:3-hydroxyacyl-[acyl-carrier-protein] dehydratase
LRFLYFDRVSELESGKRICAVKTFPLSEAYLQGHFSRSPVIPGSILIEAMSQITGWLVVYSSRCETACMISLIRNVVVPTDLRPGTTVELHGEIVDSNKRWSNCRAWVERDGDRIASADQFLFPHFQDKSPADTARHYREIGWIEPRWDWEAS